MHEMGIALQILEIAKASIPLDMPDAKVERVNLTAGKLTAIIPDNLKFCFEIAAKKTSLEGAELVINEVSVRGKCGDCGHEWIITTPAFACPECESGTVELLSGRELDIDSIEIADETG